jgi:1,4-dihydroxy-2-naphthoate octaprenyltransferase
MIENVKQILIHLRFPFSFFLLPVFLFACADIFPMVYSDWRPLFFILHFLLYPASNGYNSYMDQDTESIGGIENPKPVSSQMFGVSLVLDVVGLTIALFAYSWQMSLLLSIYILASRAYSYRGIRLKKYPVIGYLTVVVFQGAFIFFITRTALLGAFNFDIQLFVGMLISATLIGASYPLTQIFQHKQDREDGVKTISILLGLRGTFVFTASVFLLFNGLCFYYFMVMREMPSMFFALSAILMPSAIYLIWWAIRVWENPSEANYKSSMRMSILGSVSMNLFFLLFLFMVTNMSITLE